MRNHTAKPSSNKVKQTDPPKILLPIHGNHWTRKGAKFLNTKEVKANGPLTSEYAVSSINSANATEEDAVQLAYTHLVQPVLKAINAKYPHWGVQSNGENPLDDKLRVDIALRAAGRQDDLIMLIEMKKCWYIHNDEFQKALCRQDQIDTVLQYLEDEKMRSTVRENTNAYCFMQQATAYVTRTKCRYIALCDYESLILLRYRRDLCLTTVEVTIVPRDRFLLALLGFLLEACEARGG